MYVYNGATWDEVGFTVAHDVPAGGASGTLLSKASSTDYDTSWIAQSALTIAPSQVTGTALVATTADAKGDLYVASAADTVGRLAVGSDGDRFLADSGATSGVAWAAEALALPVGSYRTVGVYTSTTAATATQGLQTFWPFVVRRRMTVSEVRIYAATAPAAGGLWRLGFHSCDATGTLPGALLSDMGTVDPTVTGVKAVTALSIAFAPGVYWFSYALQGSGAGGGTFGYGLGPHLPIPRASADLTSAAAVTQGSVSGAFAGTAAPTGYAATIPMHFEMLRSA